MFGVQSLLVEEKAEMNNSLHVVAMADATIATIDSFVQSDGTNAWMNSDNMLKNEILMFNI